MSLINTIELPSGVTVTYWKLSGIMFGNAALHVTFEAYLDEKAKKEGKAPVAADASMKFDEAEIKEFRAALNGEFPTKKQLYELIKTQKEWKSATDV